MQTVNLLLSAIVQLLLLSLLPLIWWLFTARKETNFFTWLGFTKPVIPHKPRYILLFITTVIILAVPAFFIIPSFIAQAELATSQFYGKGAAMLVPALIYAFLQTGLSEEIFFKGFLTKRLSSKWGFQAGNALQSLLFGLMHGAMFAVSTTTAGVLLVILITGAAGWLMGWINEKESGGSIISSWLIHGCVNFLAALFAMFAII